MLLLVDVCCCCCCCWHRCFVVNFVVLHQSRLLGAKGLLVVNPNTRGQILIRRSMVKFRILQKTTIYVVVVVVVVATAAAVVIVVVVVSVVFIIL